jgi:hypothetical protein
VFGWDQGVRSREEVKKMKSEPVGKSPMAIAMRCSLVSLLLLLSTGKAMAQSAQLSGEVRDSSNGLIDGASVTVTNLDKGIIRRATTNGEGIYVIPFIQPGNYKVTVAKEGFQTVVHTGMVLTTAQSVVLDFVLQIGSVSETVTVNASAEHLESDNPALGVLVNRDFVENTPLNGRSFQDLIALAPGAVTSNGSTGDGIGLFSINGQREDANYYTVDGVAANLNPRPNLGPGQGTAGTLPAQTALGTTQSLVSVDALQEFKIQTSGYTAEYGRQPGGQIELTTRSGTNGIHGTLFDYFRNDVMDANDWFFNHEGIPKQAERQNDFGGTIGGPFKIPRLYDGKDRTFYFVSYEGLRLKLPQFSGVLDVPTAALRQFAAPGVQPFLNAVPLPNVPGHLTNGDQCAATLDPNYPNLPSNSPYAFSCTGEWAAGFSNSSSLDSIRVRVDQIVGQHLQLFVSYSDTPSEQNTRLFGTDLQSLTTNTHTWTLGGTLKLTSNLLDEFRFNYSSSGGNFGLTPIPFDGAIPYPKDLVVPPQYAPRNTLTGGAVFVNVPNSDAFSIPQYVESVSQQRQYNLLNNVSWARGAHTLKFGGDYRRLMPVYNPTQYSSDFNLSSITGVQQGFADSAFISAYQKAHPIFSNLSLYAQDHWKTTPRLTLDYGLRWEFNPAPGSSDGLFPLALTTSSVSTAQLALPGTPQYHTVYHDFAPRVGFAYEAVPSGVHSLVIRGGFGIFYDTGQALAAAGYSGYPFYANNTLSNLLLPASAAAIAPPSLNFPLVPPYGYISGVSDPNLKLPYTEQWNLSFDQKLNARNSLTVSYIGNAGRKLLFTEYYPNLTTVNPAFTTASLINNAASSSYNALQVQDQGYVARGMQLIASYTWAHAIDNASLDNGSFAPLRGNSDNDVRQAFNAALNYQIPSSDLNEFIRSLTRGWSLDNRFVALTGYPLDIFQGFYTLPDGTQSYIRPDLVPNVPIYLHNVSGVLGGWSLNPAAFALVPTDPNTGAPLRTGTLGRNSIHGPAFWNLNTAIQRNFALHEQLHLVFRVEAFNIFNHPNAGAIDTCLCDAAFGQSNPNYSSTGRVATVGVANPLYGTGAARSLQLMLRLQF